MGNPPDPAVRPTRARYVLVGWLCGLAGVLYLDRVCMAQAVLPIQAELGLTNTEVGYALMAFTLAYGLCEVPTGRLGDRFGSRRVLVRIVVWWSAFTALTGAVTGLGSLLAVRFLFGAGEAGAYPNAARVLARWFPAGERGWAQGLMLAASHLGGVAAPVAAAYLIAGVGWRAAFVLFGLVGVLWAAGFWRWFRDDPADHPRVNAAELAVIRDGRAAPPATAHGPVPWRAVLTNPGVWSLGAVIFCSSFNTFFYNSWFPKYLTSAHGVSHTAAGWLTTLTLAGTMTGVLTGGWLAGRANRAADPPAARRRLGRLAYPAAFLALLLAVRSDTPLSLAALAGLSSLCVQLTLPSWWSAAIEQCGRHVGSVFGLLNMVGVFGALVSQWFVGAFADFQKARGLSGRDQWDPLFAVYLGMLLLGAVGWSLYRHRPLADGRVT